MAIHWSISSGGRSGLLLSRSVTTTLSSLALVTVVLGTTGCATKGYVRERVAEAQVANDTRMTAISADVTEARTRADQAMEKATLAEKLASGAVDYTVVSTHEMRFAFDDWRLDDPSMSAIDAMATSLASRPRGVIEIRGYADARGEDRYNYRLGRERAESVERYLVTRHNVSPEKIAVLSMGEESPVASNDNEEGWAQNRRVTARLLEITAKPGDVPVAVAPAP